MKTSRWACLSNTTISPLIPKLRTALEACGYEGEFHVAEYAESSRQILTPESEFHRFDPRYLVLHLDLAVLRPGLDLSFAFEAPAQRDAILGGVLADVMNLVSALRQRTTATLLVSGFAVPARTALGVGLDPAFKSGVRRVNLDLAEHLATLQQCFLIDCESLWAEAGLSDRDERLNALAQFPLGARMQRLLIAEWMRYFRAFEGLSRKCIVTDLDNTLWKGILGEDGPAGIQMGDTPAGRPFRRLQLSLEALHRRGVLLAISSRNNPGDVLPVLESHPDMILRLDRFAAWRINWDDKASNIAALAEELNLGLQHLVFLDDNPAEREWVRRSLPEVLVPDLPADETGYADVLYACQLDTVRLTAEDRQRPEMYRQERARREFQGQASSYEEFLRNLGLRARIEPLSPQLLDRAEQLCQRTNQFNLTTRRHDADQLRRFSEAGRSIVLLISASDRFGDYGWSGLAIATSDGGCAEIDSFLMSCRVVGKRLEHVLFDAVVRWARRQGCHRIRGTWAPTARNAVCRDFYAQCGLAPLDAEAEGEPSIYEAALDSPLPRPPDCISVSIPYEEALAEHG